MNIRRAVRVHLVSALLAAAAAASVLGAQAGPAAAQSLPTRYISDIHVITGDSSSIACPDGYTRINQDLNAGSGGKFVYACAWYDANPATAIQELYVNSYFIPYGGANPNDGSQNPTCNGDIVIVGNLNEGSGAGLTSSEALNFCKHRQNTPGGSGTIAGGGSKTVFAARPDKVLTDLNFVTFNSGDVPTCNSNACVDTGLGGLSYLEVGTTIEPYCQRLGTDWHPIFRRWQYHPPQTGAGAGDQKSDVPTDAEVMNLNAGTLGAPLIYACGRFQTPPQPDTTAPTLSFSIHPDTYTLDQMVSITCSASDSGFGLASTSCPTINGKGYTFGLGQHDFAATASDYAYNTANATTSFSVVPTVYGLRVATVELLSWTNAQQVQWLASYLDAAQADPLHFATHIRDYQILLSQEASGGSLTAVADKASQLLQIAYALPKPVLVNDTQPAVQYSGAWGYYPGRPGAFKDLQNDVHAAMNDGDAAAYAFTGTGIAYISEKSDGYGLVDVYVDGQWQATVDANAAGVHNQGSQVLFSTSTLTAGQHTLKLVKKSGVYMLLDALAVQP